MICKLKTTNSTHGYLRKWRECCTSSATLPPFRLPYRPSPTSAAACRLSSLRQSADTSNGIRFSRTVRRAKMVNAVVMFIPTLLQNDSNSFFSSASIRIFTFTDAISINPSSCDVLHYTAIATECQQEGVVNSSNSLLTSARRTIWIQMRSLSTPSRRTRWVQMRESENF